VDAFGSTCEKLSGGRTVRNTDKRKLDRWLKGSTLEEVKRGLASGLDLVTISILRGKHAWEKDALRLDCSAPAEAVS